MKLNCDRSGPKSKQSESASPFLVWLAWVLGATVFVLALLIASQAQSKDDGRYANSPLHDWFMGLKNKQNIPCCDNADGQRLDDVDWDTEGDHYRVRLRGTWIDVPPTAVLEVPNRAGFAIVWWYTQGSIILIRCFIPGTAV